MATRYINPDFAVNGDGTATTLAASPGAAGAYNTWSGITWTAGNTYLQKRGTSYGAMITVGATGTAGNRITLGAYYNADGSDDTSQPKPIVNPAGASDNSIYALNRQYITVQDFDCRGGVKRGIYFAGNATAGIDMWIYRCTVNDLAGPTGEAAIWMAGNLSGLRCIDNEVLRYTGQVNILLSHKETGGATGWIVTGNNASYNLFASTTANRGAGIKVDVDAAGSYVVGAIFEDNTTSHNGLAVAGSGGGGFGILVTFGAMGWSVQNNVANYNRVIGIKVIGGTTLGAGGATVAVGLDIGNNECSYNGEFGIQVNNIKGIDCHHNTCRNNGGNACGAAVATGSGYGRAIELYEASLAGNVTGVVRNNIVSGTRASTPINNFTEGVGIGIDNYTCNLRVFGNTITDNEGNGIQVTGGTATSNIEIYSNVLVNNCTQATDSTTDSGYSARTYEEHYASIYLPANTTYMKVYNNVIVCSGAKEKFGIAIAYANPGTGSFIKNNIITGASVAAISAFRTNVPDVTTNIIKGCAAECVTTTDSGATNAAQADDGITPDETLTLTSDYKLPSGSSYIEAGTHVAYSNDSAGHAFWNPPSIGAYEVMRARSLRT